ncbi:hypothetical protein ACU8NH_09005 [Rhizobium leguminosarum]
MTKDHSALEAAVNAFAKQKWTDTDPHVCMRAAISAYLATSKPVAVKVKQLEWSRGYCDEQVTISRAQAIGGSYQVRVLDGVVWLDKPLTQTIYPSVEEAKAAAQEHWESSIMSALTTPTQPEACGPIAWWIVGSSAVTTDKDVTDRWRLGNPDSNIVRLYASPPQPEFAAALKRIADETTMGEPFKNENRIMSRDDMIEHARAALNEVAK